MIMNKSEYAPKQSRLTQKVSDFIRFYTDKTSPTYDNATQSYIKAGYSPKGANVSASQLLSRPSVQAELARIAEREAQAFDWSFERWQKEVISIYEALPPTNANKLKSAELIGKAKGYIRESGITLNTFTLSSEDVERARDAIGSKLASKRLDHEAQSNVEAKPNVL